MDLGIPELTSSQVEAVSKAAEDAARKHIFSKVKHKQVETLNIIIEAEGNKPISFVVEIDLILSPDVKGISEKTLAEEALEKAFSTIEDNLRKLK